MQKQETFATRLQNARNIKNAERYVAVMLREMCGDADTLTDESQKQEH